MHHKDENEHSPKDPNLDTPGEAATQKHINFLEAEEQGNEAKGEDNNWSKDRKEEWQRGLEEGRQARNNE